MLRHVNGAVSVIDCSYATKRDPDPFPEVLLEIEGRRGSLVLSPGLELRVTSDGETTARALCTPLLPWTSEPWHVSQESVLNTQKHWIECLKVGDEPQTLGRDNLKTYALVEAAYESAKSSRGDKIGSLASRSKDATLHRMNDNLSSPKGGNWIRVEMGAAQEEFPMTD